MENATCVSREGAWPTNLCRLGRDLHLEKTNFKNSEILGGPDGQGTRTKIGENCVINTGAIIDHDCKIHEGCHVAPGATVCGGVVVDKFSLIGAGSVILNNLTIAESKIIPANSCYKGFES